MFANGSLGMLVRGVACCELDDISTEIAFAVAAVGPLTCVVTMGFYK